MYMYMTLLCVLLIRRWIRFVEMAAAVVDSDKIIKTDVMLFNRWSYDDVQVFDLFM